MAGAGWRDFVTGEVVTEPMVQTYLQDQVVMVFASSAARATALSGVLAEGMVSYLADTNLLYFYDGSAWVQIPATVNVRKNSAGTVFSQPRINFIEGSNVTLTVADDGTEIDVTIATATSPTDRVTFAGFSRELSAVGTNTQLFRVVVDESGGPKGIAIPIVVDRAGSIVGISCHIEDVRAGGTLTLEVYKNGTGTGLTVVIDGTNTQYNSAVQAAGTDTFVANDRLDVRGTTSTFSPTADNYVEAAITLIYG